MSDTMGSDPTSPGLTGQIQADLEFDRWAIGVEARLDKAEKLRLFVYAEGGIAVAALGLSFLAFRGLTNLTKALAQLNEVTGSIAATLWPQPVTGPVATPPPVGTDETKAPPSGSVVAEPVMGPTSEPSEEVKGMILGDPIKPGDILKDEGLKEYNPEIHVSPTMDRVDDTADD